MQTSLLSQAHLPWVPKYDTVHFFHMILKLIHSLENQLAASHTGWLKAIVSPGSLRKWLSTWPIRFVGCEKVLFNQVTLPRCGILHDPESDILVAECVFASFGASCRKAS